MSWNHSPQISCTRHSSKMLRVQRKKSVVCGWKWCSLDVDIDMWVWLPGWYVSEIASANGRGGARQGTVVRFAVFRDDLPFGKHTKNNGKSPLFTGKSTINGDFP